MTCNQFGDLAKIDIINHYANEHNFIELNEGFGSPTFSAESDTSEVLGSNVILIRVQFDNPNTQNYKKYNY